MGKFKNHLIIAVIFALLAAIGTTMKESALSGKSPDDVNIVSPLPVPVSGTVGISGQPVGVNVANTPNVNIANTPSVSIANSPSVNIGSPVTVGNPATNPVLTSEAGKAPYSATCAGAGQIQGRCAIASCTFTVPAGRRLVIQSLTGDANMSVTDTLLIRLMGSSPSGQDPQSSSSGFSMIVPVKLQFGNGVFNFYGTNETTTLQVDPNGTVTVELVNTCSQTASEASLNLSGYTVPSP
jgi:hypothetical protein